MGVGSGGVGGKKGAVSDFDRGLAVVDLVRNAALYEERLTNLKEAELRAAAEADRIAMGRNIEKLHRDASQAKAEAMEMLANARKEAATAMQIAHAEIERRKGKFDAVALAHLKEGAEEFAKNQASRVANIRDETALRLRVDAVERREKRAAEKLSEANEMKAAYEDKVSKLTVAMR